jgi:cytoskeletal protein CcmA (bactofilin family)
MRRMLQSQQGVAMIMALGAIVIIGVLMGSVLFVSTQDYRVGSNTVRTARAAAAAELGLNRIPVDWSLADNSRLKTGDTLKKAYTTPGGATAAVVITRLDGPFFWAVSEGYAGGMGSQASARRRYGVLFRLNMPNMNFMGAITTQGNTTVSGNVTVNGNDAAPAGWSGCSGTQNVAGAAISPTTTATVNGSVTLSGNPSVLTTPAASDSNTYFNYGNSNYQSIAASANLTYAGGTLLTGVQPLIVGGACQASALPANWGEPNHTSPAGACDSYFPIIHVLGDLKVTTGRGQGILLVDGDLTVAGNFTFDGAVIARGGLKMSGTGNKIVGGVMAASVTVSDSVALSGNTSLLYSSCALQAALSSSAYPTQAMQRSWVDLF